MNLRIAIAAGSVVLGSLISCGTVQPGGRATHHSTEYRNEGLAPVRGVAIQYGEYVLPRGNLSYEMVPGVASTDIRTIPVPKAVEISWRSADGVHHSAGCELSTAVGRSEEFFGFAFVFRDGSVEVQQVRAMMIEGRIDRLARVTLCPGASAG